MKRFLAVFIFTLVAACAQLGIPIPDTFNERIAVAYTLDTTVRQTATTLLHAKKITADDAQNVLDTTNSARVGLDIARKLSTANTTAADAKLAAVRTVLTGLQDYLAIKGAH